MAGRASLFATEAEAVDAAFAMARVRLLTKKRKEICLQVYASLGLISLYELKRSRGGPAKVVVGRFGWVVPGARSP